MSSIDRITTSAGELVRQFSHFADLSRAQPVVVTEDGLPRNVLISFEEYERLKRRDQQAFRAEDTPEHFIEDMRAFLREGE